VPTLLVHALLAAAVQGLICVALVGQGINEFVFYAAIVSILVNLDHRSDEERSSVVHSLFTVSLVSLVCMTGVAIAHDLPSKTLAISFAVGFTSHVLLDTTDGDGIYVVPWSAKRVAPSRMYERTGRSKRRRGHLILAVLSALALLVLLCV
jgi:hypothetical protein